MTVNFSIADSSRDGRTFVVWVRGRLDARSADLVVTRVTQAAADPETALILDMTGVTMVEPAGLHDLADIVRPIRDLTRVKIVAPPLAVADLLEDAGLMALVELAPPRGDERRTRTEPVPVERRAGRDRRRLTPPPLDDDAPLAELRTEPPVRAPSPPAAGR